MAHRAAEEAPQVPHGRAVPGERERIVVKLSLPRDALIEFEVRCWLGLRMECRAARHPASPTAVGHGPVEGRR